jgi:hypothetical protein
MSATSSDPVTSVLDRAERHARSTRLAVLGAVAVEGLLLLLSFLIIDWNSRTHVLILLFAVLVCSVLGLGLLALGAHVSRVGDRVVAALDASQ